MIARLIYYLEIQENLEILDTSPPQDVISNHGPVFALDLRTFSSH